MAFKNIKGLTLVEVLVSVVITILVMVYGITIFISAWKLEVDSEEYSTVLQYMTNKIEGYKNYANVIDVYRGTYKEIPFPDIELPSKKKIELKLIMYNMGKFANTSSACPDTIPVTLIAKWPKNPSAFQKQETIYINTFFSKNMESYFKGDYSNKLNNEFIK